MRCGVWSVMRGEWSAKCEVGSGACDGKCKV